MHFCILFKVQTVGTTAKVMQANSKMAEVMGETTKAMGQMNKLTNPAKLNKTLQEFSKESTKMEMTDEMSTLFILFIFYKFCKLCILFDL
jgi:hypothetical protein